MLSAHWSQPLQHHFPMEMEARGTDHLSSPLPFRKRKAESQPESNERLSKRLSLLNLEQSGTKLYVPVENSQSQRTNPTQISSPPSTSSLSQKPQMENDSMQLDNSKHKVYIYNIDDELSSESESEDGKLVFLPDIEKHLRQNRIPAQVLASPDTDFLGKELVLYSIPSSISVPGERDSVRKAIIEARARVREQQEAERMTGSRVPDFDPAASSLFGQARAGLQELTNATNGLNHYNQGPFAPAAPVVGADAESDEMDLD